MVTVHGNLHFDISTAPCSAFIPHVDPSGTLYVQLAEDGDALATMSDLLEEQLSRVQAVSQVEVGVSLCARFTEDDVWYR